MVRRKPKANSRAKGVRGELAAARKFKEHGFHAERGQQYSGGDDSPDIKVPALQECFHHEVKNTEKLRLYLALEQATEDSDAKQMPVVLHQRNRKPMVAILDFDDYIELVKVYMEFKDFEAEEEEIDWERGFEG